MRRLAAGLGQMRLSLSLLLGRRLVGLLVADVFLVLVLLVVALAGDGGEPASLYRHVALLPPLLLGVPLLSELVALERRSGSLDLALSVPRAETYFLRRLTPALFLMALQGGSIMLLTWLVAESVFPIVVTSIQLVLVVTVIGGAAMFWALRLKTAGGVALATLLTCLGLGRWLFWNPAPDPAEVEVGWYFLASSGTFDWLRVSAVLAGAAILFHLDARRRIARPERLLS